MNVCILLSYNRYMTHFLVVWKRINKFHKVFIKKLCKNHNLMLNFYCGFVKKLSYNVRNLHIL